MATKKTVKKAIPKKAAKLNSKTSAPALKEKLQKTSVVEPKKIETEIKKETPSINVAKKEPMDAELKRKLVAVSTGIILIGLFAGFSFYSIPNQILSQTIDKQNARKAEEDKKNNNIAREGVQSRLDFEAGVLKFDQNKSWDLAMDIKNFGEIKLNLKSEYAPKTVENFVRLSYRDYFNNSIFHRMVEQPGFSVIQGGDGDKRNGQGGKSAFYISETEKQNIPDEIWITAPEFTTVGETNTLVNKPEFRFPSLYGNFDTDSGSVTYKKGLILMAKTSEPNSASSQFFVTLTDTTLPAQYTIFGTVDSSSFAVLDKITKEVNPIAASKEGTETISTDGKPSKELIINTLKIVSPKI